MSSKVPVIKYFAMSPRIEAQSLFFHMLEVFPLGHRSEPELKKAFLTIPASEKKNFVIPIDDWLTLDDREFYSGCSIAIEPRHLLLLPEILKQPSVQGACLQFYCENRSDYYSFTEKIEDKNLNTDFIQAIKLVYPCPKPFLDRVVFLAKGDAPSERWSEAEISVWNQIHKISNESAYLMGNGWTGEISGGHEVKVSALSRLFFDVHQSSIRLEAPTLLQLLSHLWWMNPRGVLGWFIDVYWKMIWPRISKFVFTFVWGHLIHTQIIGYVYYELIYHQLWGRFVPWFLWPARKAYWFLEYQYSVRVKGHSL